ncbi:hypothetical protein FZW96_14240 [Bacillus sp. BGMRC 2118]|nr:hypothetical protein FZW96_14240 [Bacillus sp. BGMRC 2118]
MNKNYTFYVIFLLIFLLGIAIFKNNSLADTVTELKIEEKALEEAREDNKELMNNYKEMNEKYEDLKVEVDALKAPIIYSNLTDSIAAVEEFLDVVIPVRNQCPCTFKVNNYDINWIHPPSTLPYEFRVEERKIYLAYESQEYYDYELVIGKTSQGKWAVESIKYKEKK